MRMLGITSVLALLWGGVSLGQVAADGSILVKSFHDAVALGDVAKVREMLTEQPSLATTVAENGFMPMQLQDMYFEDEILDLLLAHGADINSGNDEGVTILHIITDPAAIPELIARGANLEARDVHGWTPLLMNATNQADGPDVVEALLRAGADPSAQGNRGETALSLALEREEESELVAMLRRAGRE